MKRADPYERIPMPPLMRHGEPRTNREMLVITSRELEIVDGLVRGLAPRGIARELGISKRTVDEHLYSIRDKIGARSVCHLVAIAVRSGWTS